MSVPTELESEVSELQRHLAQVDLLTGTTRQRNKDAIEFLLFKRSNLRFKMYQEPGHSLPHIHIDYGRENHIASYSIDPAARIVGTLDRKYDRTVTEWVSSHKEMLLNLWTVVQAGGKVSNLAIELAGDA